MEPNISQFSRNLYISVSLFIKGIYPGLFVQFVARQIHTNTPQYYTQLNLNQIPCFIHCLRMICTVRFILNRIHLGLQRQFESIVIWLLKADSSPKNSKWHRIASMKLYQFHWRIDKSMYSKTVLRQYLVHIKYIEDYTPFIRMFFFYLKEPYILLML